MFTIYPEDAFFAAETAAEATAQAVSQAKFNMDSKHLVAKATIAAVIAGVAYLATRPRVKRAVAELFKAESV